MMSLYIIALFTVLILMTLLKYLLNSDAKRDHLIDILCTDYLFAIVENHIKNNDVKIDQIYMYDYNYYHSIYTRELHSLLEKDILNGEFKNIKKDLPKELSRYYNINVLNEAIDTIVKFGTVERLIQKQFMNKVDTGIDEANKNEETAIEYHKQFGSESSGDPELHPKDINNDNSSNDDSLEKTLEELSSTGTVEDIDE